MFQFIPVAEDNIFAVKVSGKLTDADYQAFLPELEALIKEHRPISLLLELDDFHGWEPKAAWDDFRFGMKHDQDFNRIAIVGEKTWHRWMTALGNAFTEANIRFFNRDQFQEAWDWLREGERQASGAGEESAEDDKPPPWRHLLVAVDFSPVSRLAVARAVELCRLYRARLSLIHAVEMMGTPLLDYDVLMTDPVDFLELDQQRFEQAGVELRRMADSLDLEEVQTEVMWGTPKSAVLSYAEAQKVDAIVVGSHGRHGVARLLGSTAAAIANSARTDVLVVRQQDSAS
ncbi:STAS/SEC14 domain-containing protein [Thiolapillus sp.]